MQISKQLALCAFLGLFSVSIQSNVIEYYGLSSPQRDIHILFDEHIGSHGVSTRKMDQQPLETFKNHFYPSERAFLDSLKALNNSPAARSVEVIWESSTPGYTDHGANEFIAYGSTIVQRHFKNLKIDHADQARVRFEAPFLDGFNRHHDMGIYQDPMPLPQERINRIIKNSGQKTWLDYKAYYDRSKRELQIQFKPHVDRQSQLWEDYFNENDAFDRLCDVEILSHILASDKKTVIVYAGGWHGYNLVQLLQRAGCRVTRHIGNSTHELHPSFIQTLYKDAMGRYQQTIKMGAIVKATTPIKPQPKKPTPAMAKVHSKTSVKTPQKINPVRKPAAKVAAKKAAPAKKSPLVLKKSGNVYKPAPAKKVVAPKAAPKKFVDRSYDDYENYYDGNDCICGQCYR